MVGQLQIPAAERKASVNKANDKAPAKKANIKTDAGKAAASPAKVVAPAIAPAASRVEPAKAVRLNAKTKTEVSQPVKISFSKWHGGGQHGRPHTKPQLQLAQGRTH
jgi:hypothetical protein